MADSSNARSVIFGFDDHQFEAGRRVPVAWSEEFATNGHMLVTGKSGTGKTFTLRRIIGQMIRPLPGRRPPRVHIYDVHGDIRFDGESRILFSESSPYGINPLRLSPHPHFGGVRKCVQAFIDMVIDSSGTLGPRQVAALRNVLYDLFAERGFHLEDPSTWSIDDEGDAAPDEQGRIFLVVPYDEREVAKSVAKAEGTNLQWCPQHKLWWTSDYKGNLQRWPTQTVGRRAPTVPDVLRFLVSRLKSMQMGTSGKCIRMLEDHNKKVQALQKLLLKFNRTGIGADEAQDLKEDINQSSCTVVETFTDYVMSIETGAELDALNRFESIDTLKSLMFRIETLASSGIFRSRKPAFNPDTPVWAYDISPLSEAEQKFFVWTSLRQIFEEAKQGGIVQGASEVHTVIVLDEAHKFFSDKETNILDILSREARKFGISLIAASQAPSHFSEDFLGNVGTKVLLGLDAMYHDQTVRKMRIESKTLDYVVPGKIAAVQVSDKRDMTHKFLRTRVGS